MRNPEEWGGDSRDEEAQGTGMSPPLEGDLDLTLETPVGRSGALSPQAINSSRRPSRFRLERLKRFTALELTLLIRIRGSTRKGWLTPPPRFAGVSSTFVFFGPPSLAVETSDAHTKCCAGGKNTAGKGQRRPSSAQVPHVLLPVLRRCPAQERAGPQDLEEMPLKLLAVDYQG